MKKTVTGKNKTKGPAKKQKKKMLLTSLAVGAAGILGYFGWQYLKKKKAAKGTDVDNVLPEASSASTNFDLPAATHTAPRSKSKSIRSSKPSATNQSTAFPLKRGSKGELVRRLQEALITKHGKSILPKYGADADFGSETVNALKKLGLPASIDQNIFNVLTAGSSASKSSLGQQLHAAAIAKDFKKTVALLKTMKSKDDYSTANQVFKSNRTNGVRQTIVNGLLNTFTKEDQKQQIRFELLRIGLQFDGNKWSLSGFDGLTIITVKPATVWINAYEGVKVPARMVLGSEVSRRLDYTLFENKGKYFLVNTISVNYLN